MARSIVAIICLLYSGLLFSQEASEIIESVDRNLYSESKVLSASMTIHGRHGRRTITFNSWVQGSRRSFTEYLSPAEEQGTKMLKLGSQLWLYSPSADRVIQISGHMLRQSVMGSDLSYEDMMEERRLSDIYDAEMSGQDTLQGRKVWVLKLVAKVSDAVYHSQRLWVDQERLIPLRQELYAKSGAMLKMLEVKRADLIQGRWYPMTVIFKDVLKKGGGTEFDIKKIDFNQKIPDHLFSKAALRK